MHAAMVAFFASFAASSSSEMPFNEKRETQQIQIPTAK
jgi:hypothetical protein